MNRLPLIILGILVLASAGFGVYQLDQIQKLKQSAVAWDSERAALQKKIWDLQRQNGELERRRAGAGNGAVVSNDNAPSGRGDGAPAGGPGPGDATFRGRPDGGRFNALLSNPEVQKLMAVQQKGALDSRYSSLFKQLNLSPADLEKFKNLLVEKQSAVMDVMAAARSEGLTGRENRDQIRDLVQNAQNEVDATIRSTLGDAAYAQYQNYEATQPQRAVVSQLEQRLSYSSTPLSDTQSQQLVQILAETSPTHDNGGGMRTTISLGGAGGPGMFFGGPTITADTVNRAQGVLSTQQMSALQSLQQEQQASAALRQQMRANFQNSTQTTTPATAVSPTSVTKAGPTKTQ